MDRHRRQGEVRRPQAVQKIRRKGVLMRTNWSYRMDRLAVIAAGFAAQNDKRDAEAIAYASHNVLEALDREDDKRREVC